MTKRCSKCGEVKARSEFAKNRANTSGLSSWCKSCIAEQGHKHRAEHPEWYREKYRKKQANHPGQNRKQCRQYRLKHQEQIRERLRKRCYGITSEEYRQLYETQNGRCAICGLPQELLNKNLFVDHEHGTDKVRGLLCSTCNTILGTAYDDVTILQAAINYLQNSAKTEVKRH
jgi:hypothetical protein